MANKKNFSLQHLNKMVALLSPICRDISCFWSKLNSLRHNGEYYYTKEVEDLIDKINDCTLEIYTLGGTLEGLSPVVVSFPASMITSIKGREYNLELRLVWKYDDKQFYWWKLPNTPLSNIKPISTIIEKL